MRVRLSLNIPSKVMVCQMCGSETSHAAIVTEDINKDGKVDEKDAVWVPSKQHLAPCGAECAANLTKSIPDTTKHGFSGKCAKCNLGKEE